MGNMSYCRFQNTNDDLSDCMSHTDDLDLSKDENDARIELIEKCIEIAKEFKFHAIDGQSVEDYYKDNKEDGEDLD